MNNSAPGVPNQNSDQTAQVTPVPDISPPPPTNATPPPAVFSAEASPPMDIGAAPPPVIPSSSDAKAANFVPPPPTKPKFSTGKIIATIFGVLLLVGGVGVGVYLVQQQQEIREKAAEITPENCREAGGVCFEECAPDHPNCNIEPKSRPISCWAGVAEGSCLQIDCFDANGNYQQVYERDTKCEGGGKTPSHKRGPCGSTCLTTADCNDGSVCVKVDKANPPRNECINPICRNRPDVCDPTRCTALVPCDEKDCRIAGSQCTPEGTCNLGTGFCDCGKTPPSAQCQTVKIYDTNWNLLSLSDLANLTAGTKVRLAVAGTASSGTFNKARFTVNGTLRAEVTAKKPGSEEFYDEYTIPADVSSLDIHAEIHHLESNQWY